jgi:LPXTG-site transpeptidase (sortase) family protein
MSPFRFRKTGNLNRERYFLVVLVLILAYTFTPSTVEAAFSVPQTDQTPLAPLSNPGSPIQPRYISGFGLDNIYTIFFENRADQIGCTNLDTYRIYFNQTISGPFGFSATSTATDLCETHFTVKNWPITIGMTSYAYRGWGAQGNNPNHGFYVSNNLVNWTTIYTGPNMFQDPLGVMGGETINYGFHDIIELNGHFLGFAESAGGNTYIVESDNGDENWTVMAEVGGSQNTDGPLALSFSLAGPLPTGNFLLMEVDGQLVYGKLMVPGNRQGAYLAINSAAAQASTPALAEAAFMDITNWTWRDGTSWVAPGAANATLLPIAAHTISEVWSAPASDSNADFVTIYTASYGGTRGVGCAAENSQCLVVLHPATPKMLPASGFPHGKVTRVGIQPVEREYDPSTLWLEIPKLGLVVPVTGIPLVNGTWDVSWLHNQVGYLEGTAFPTWSGNSVITGHVWNADNTPGPFVSLNKLSWGNKVVLHAWGQQYIYEVRTVKKTLPDDVTSALEHKDHPWITLLTCQGFDGATEQYKYRLVVKAVQVAIK